MKNILSALVLLITMLSCNKNTFYDKFVPEILYYQNADVENADFKSILLAKGTTQYAVKARVSAPMKLKEVKILKVAGSSDELLETYTDFQLSPTVYKLNYVVKSLAAQTTIKVVAMDQDNKITERNFVINVTP